MYYFLGVQRIDFTNRETGERIQGWNVHFTEPADNRGSGVIPFRKFFTDDAFAALGGLDFFKDRQFSEVSIQFGRNGRVMDFRFISASK